MNTFKTYIAFDCTGVRDAENSNLPTFKRLNQWKQMNPDRYNFANLEDIKFAATHDEILENNLKHNLLEKMKRADNMIIVASDKLNTESYMLNWQISRAVNGLHMPVIVCYAGLTSMTDELMRDHEKWLPNKIKKYMRRKSARIAHIPLTKDKLERALNAYSRNEGLYPWDESTIF